MSMTLKTPAAAQCRASVARRIGLGVVSLALVAGCSTSLPGTDDQTPKSNAQTGDSVRALLSLVPLTDDPGLVGIARWHAAAKAFDVEIPDADATTTEVGKFFLRLSSDNAAIYDISPMVNLSYLRQFPTKDDFGFVPQSVAADVVVGAPPRQLSAAVGSFDLLTIRSATKSGTVGDQVTETKVDGVPVLRWFEDLRVDVKTRTALTPTGNSGRLALTDSKTLQFSTTDAGAKNLIAAVKGSGKSLDDDPQFAEIAKRLDADDALSALMLRRPSGSDLPYESVGVGFTYRKGTPSLTIVYVARSSSDASTVAAEIKKIVTSGSTLASKRPWTDLLLAPKFTTSGKTVVARFDLARATNWYQFVMARENLF